MASSSGWLAQLGAAAERGFRVERGPGEARFTFLGARLQGCAFSWKISPRLLAQPCVLLEGGAVIVQGFIDDPRSVSDPWFAVGPLARLGLDVGPASVLVEGGPIFPLTTGDRVVFGDVNRPEGTVHDVPWIGGFGSVGLAFELE